MPELTRLKFAAMQLSDLPAIDQLERVCFPMPWPLATYQHELQNNRLGAYWVIRPAAENQTTLPPILAYGGYWLMGDEAHIMTIATHPDWRRHHLGEWLLLEMLSQVREHGGTTATLEVRIHNLGAQQLYQKLGFVQVGLRKRYYTDNGEDALLLTLHRLDNGAVWRPLAQRIAALRTAFQPANAA